MIMKTSIALTLATLLAIATTNVYAEAPFEYKKQLVKGSISILHGAGGNIGVLQGEEGLLVIDNGFDSNSSQLEKSLAAYGDSPRFLLNTHWHGDHTGGNAALTKVATLMAHENVRKRLAKGVPTGQRVIAPAPESALPDVTYKDGITLHFAGQTVSAVHFPAGHTDGDTVVFFEPAHVVHMGDLMFADKFPYIDPSSGGSVAGYTKNVAAILSQIDDTSVVVPGHGVVTDKAGVQRFYQMIVETTQTVKAMKVAGKTLEQAQATGLDMKWASWGDFFIDEDRWIAILWAGTD